VVSGRYEGMFEGPIVMYVRNVVLEAFREKATDIVLRQDENGVTLRYRRGDQVLPVPSPPQKAQFVLFDYLKDVAGLSKEGASASEDGEISYTQPSEVLNLPVTLRRAPDAETIVIRLSQEEADGS